MVRMNIKRFTIWKHIVDSFWFLPALMVVATSFLALLMITIDQSNPATNLPLTSWIYSGSPDGARSLLSTIAGSMISVAGVTFSITITTLSLASSQLGPRLLNNFMRNRGNQIVLGTFVSIFTYCLLVLRTVRSPADATFVPHLSVTLAIFLALISVGVLIFFLHHVSTMIQAQNVVADIGRELSQSIERLFSAQASNNAYEYKPRGEDDIPSDLDDNLKFITTNSSGYLQAIDYEALKRIATENDLLLRLEHGASKFVVEGSEIIGIHPADKFSDSIEEKIRDAFSVGARQLRTQDVEYTINQLVEIAVRALSPGINDPFTAIACLDQFSTTLSDLAKSAIPAGYYYDADGSLRIISNTITFEEIIDTAFNQIRQHGRTDIAVTVRLLEVIAVIMARTRTDAQRNALMKQAEMIKRSCDELTIQRYDMDDIEARYNLIQKMLTGNNPSQ